jgi:hypothetical protein
VALKYDGRWHDTPEQVVHDHERRQRREAEGWLFVIVNAEQLATDYEAIPEPDPDRRANAVSPLNAPLGRRAGVWGPGVTGLLGAGGELGISRVVDGDQGEPVRGSHCALPDAAAQQSGRPIDVTPAVTYQQQSTHEAPHHRMAERICRHVDLNGMAASPVPGQALQFSDRSSTRALFAERREVMESEQR